MNRTLPALRNAFYRTERYSQIRSALDKVQCPVKGLVYSETGRPQDHGNKFGPDYGYQSDNALHATEQSRIFDDAVIGIGMLLTSLDRIPAVCFHVIHVI